MFAGVDEPEFAALTIGSSLRRMHEAMKLPAGCTMIVACVGLQLRSSANDTVKIGSDDSAKSGPECLVLKIPCGVERCLGVDGLAAADSRMEIASTSIRAVVCFMPGFWGYESWKTGIRALAAACVPVVSTAYTLEEAEDDEDVLTQLRSDTAATATDASSTAAAGALVSLLWEAEATPAGVGSSTAGGKCPATGRLLVENAAWVGWTGILPCR